LFLLTTDPSEFAASLTGIRVPYKLSYAVSITLRYIADIQTDFHNISQAQQARGVDLSKKTSLKKRISGIAIIAVPLIFSSLDRIDLISNAMDLRDLERKKKERGTAHVLFRRQIMCDYCRCNFIHHRTIDYFFRWTTIFQSFIS
jgi:energy-coupling factor transport system permease protein